MDSNARAAGGEVDPFTWVLLAEVALGEQRKEEAETLIEEAFRAYDERQIILRVRFESQAERAKRLASNMTQAA